MVVLEAWVDWVQIFIRNKAEQPCTPEDFAVLDFYSTETGTLRRGDVYLVVRSEKYRSSSRWSTRNLTDGSSSRGSTFLMIRKSSNPSPCGVGCSTSPGEPLKYFCCAFTGRSPSRQSARR